MMPLLAFRFLRDNQGQRDLASRRLGGDPQDSGIAGSSQVDQGRSGTLETIREPVEQDRGWDHELDLRIVLIGSESPSGPAVPQVRTQNLGRPHSAIVSVSQDIANDGGNRT